MSDIGDLFYALKVEKQLQKKERIEVALKTLVAQTLKCTGGRTNENRFT